jgi:hypothetical protein
MSDLGDLGSGLEQTRRRKNVAAASGGQALLRLLLARTRDSGQVRCSARFLSSTYNAVIDLWGLKWPYEH